MRAFTCVTFLFLATLICPHHLNAQDCPPPKAYEYKSKIENANNNWTTDQKIRSNCIQGWTQLATWFAYKCECDRGMPTQEQADLTVASLNKIQSVIQNMYPNCGEIPPRVSMCNVKVGNPDNGNSNFINKGVVNSNKHNNNTNEKSGVLMNDSFLSVLDEISGGSENQNFKDMVNEIKANKSKISSTKALVSQFGFLQQSDIDFYNFAESAGQVIAVATFLYKTFSKKITPEQKELNEGKIFIDNLSNVLSTVYNEIRIVPTFYNFDKQTLTRLNNLENRIKRYQVGSASRRFLVSEYYATNTPMTLGEIKSKMKEINSKEQSKGTASIVRAILRNSKISELNNLPFINLEGKLNVTFNRIAIAKSKCYKAMGRDEDAVKILYGIDYNVNPSGAFKLIHESFKDKNIYSTIKYYESVKDYIKTKENGKVFYLKYKEIEVLNNYHNGLERVDVAYLISLGCISYITSGQISQAKEELKFLRWYNQNLNNFLKKYKEKKLKTMSDTDIEIILNKCLVFERALEALLLAKEGEFGVSLMKIDKAIILQENLGYDFFGLGIESWLYQIKLNVLIHSNQFLKAKTIAREIKNRNRGFASKKTLFDIGDYKFLLAFMKFKEGKLNSSLSSLILLENEFPNMKRINLLRRDIYLELGEYEKAKNQNNLYKN